MVFHEKQMVRLGPRSLSINAFPGDNCHTSECNLSVLPLSSYRMLKRHKLQRLICNKIKDFHWVLKDILKENWLFFPPTMCGREDCMTTGIAGCHSLDSYNCINSFAYNSFCIRVNVNTVKRNKNNFNLADQGDPQVLGSHRPYFKNHRLHNRKATKDSKKIWQ